MSRKAGFTLLEAMTVIAITGLTVSLIYTVGMRGVFTGFRLGNRALSTADMEVAKTAYRDVVASLVIPPVAVSSQAAEDELSQRIDDSFVGTPVEVAGRLIAMRETPCALTGADGRISLTFETDDSGTTLFCSLDEGEGAGEPVELMRLRFGPAAFSYSEDGLEWFEDWTVERGLPVDRQALPNGELRRVLIRLAGADGDGELIALASSGRAVAQTAPQPGGGGGGGGGGRGGGGRGGGGPDGGGRGGGRGGGG
jgi:uncharacterized membrane protein YgcG